MSIQDIPSGRDSDLQGDIPVDYSALSSSEGPLPACAVCGRQDESLRLVVYPVVFSFIVVTFRRAFAGLWCETHRRLQLVIASIITGTVGWLGVPFGFLFAPVSLVKLALGGTMPAVENMRILRQLTGFKMRAGDPGAAIACLEASLQFSDDVDIRQQLHGLYLRTPSVRSRVYDPLLLALGSILAVSVVGLVFGLVDSASALVLGDVLGQAESAYVAILAWSMMVALVFLSGLILFYLVTTVLAHVRCQSYWFGDCFALAAAGFTFYGLLTGESLGSFLRFLLTSGVQESPDGQLITMGAVLTRGAAWLVRVLLQDARSTSSLIYLAILAASAVYYVVLVLVRARQTVQWQERIAAAQAGTNALTATRLASAWGVIALLVVGWGAVAFLYPQKSIVDYMEAINHNDRGRILQDEAEQAQPPDTVLSDQAIQQFKMAINLLPDAAMFHTDLGTSLLDENRLDEATAEYKQAVLLDPNDWTSHVGLGAISLRQGNGQVAISELQVATRLEPSYADGYRMLGYAYVQEGQHEAAVSAFEKVLDLNPSDFLARVYLGLEYAAQGRPEEANRELQTALQLSPDSGLVDYGFGYLYSRKGDLDRAVTELQQAIREEPRFDEAMLLLGMAYAGRAEFDKAVDQFQSAIKLDSRDGTPHAALAIVYYEQDRLDMMQREIELAEEYEWEGGRNTPVELAAAYTVQNKFVEAESHLRKALERHLNNPDLYLFLAGIYRAEGEFDLAWQMADKALMLQRNNANVYSERGRIYLAQEKYDQALEEFVRAQEMAPWNGEIHSLISFVAHKRGQSEKALSEAQEAVRLQPYSSGAHESLAFANLDSGNVSSTILSAQRAVQLDPKRDTAHYVLGLGYQQTGENGKAIAELNKFLELYRDRAYVRDYKVKAQEYLKSLLATGTSTP